MASIRVLPSPISTSENLTLCDVCMRYMVSHEDKAHHLLSSEHSRNVEDSNAMTAHFYTKNCQHRKSLLHETTVWYGQPGLLGLEYIVELYNLDTKSVRFRCRLCNELEDHNDIMGHLNGTSHRLFYLKAHFPSLLGHLRIYMNTATNYTADKLLNRVCRLLDKNAGRLRPYALDDRFADQMTEKLGRADQMLHHDETHFTGLSKLVRHEEILSMMSLRGLLTTSNWNKAQPLVVLIERPANFECDVPSRRGNGMPIPKMVESPPIADLFELVHTRRVSALQRQHRRYDQDPHNHPEYASERAKYFRRHGATNSRDTCSNLLGFWADEWAKRVKREYTEALEAIPKAAAGDLLDALNEHASIGWDGVRVTQTGLVYADDKEDAEKIDEAAAAVQPYVFENRQPAVRASVIRRRRPPAERVPDSKRHRIELYTVFLTRVGWGDRWMPACNDFYERKVRRATRTQLWSKIKRAKSIDGGPKLSGIGCCCSFHIRKRNAKIENLT